MNFRDRNYMLTTRTKKFHPIDLRNPPSCEPRGFALELEIECACRMTFFGQKGRKVPATTFSCSESRRSAP